MRIFSYPQLRLSVLFFLLLLLFFSCRKEQEKSPFSIAVFYQQMKTLTIEVAYEQGAEPYDFNAGGENIWAFTEMNIESLFVFRPIQIDVFVPTGIAAMTQISAQNKNSFTANDILNLAARYRTSEGTNDDGNIFVLFLNGYFMQDDTVRQNIAGVHITGTTVVAVFKPIVTTSHVTKIVREFVEQSIVIHETGHALGLVKNGLPLTSSHQDTDHGAHCKNAACVMYWENERNSNVAAFVQSYLGGNKKMLFGSECVADVTDYAP